MATRPLGYGLTAEITQKMANKYSTELEQVNRHAFLRTTFPNLTGDLLHRDHIYKPRGVTPSLDTGSC